MENANHTGENVSPQNIDEMNDEEFEAYIKSAEDDNVTSVGNTGNADPAENAEPYISFGTKEELQEYQDKTIGSRLREIREEKEKFGGLCELAKERYNTADEAEAMQKLKDELTGKNADNAGMSRGEYALMNELRLLKSETEYNKRVDAIRNEWKKQEAALKNIVPDFDLERAFENTDFYDAVVGRHMSITEAYPLLQKQSYSISEIGNLSGGVGGYIKQDVASMSDKEFDEYIKKIKNS